MAREYPTQVELYLRAFFRDIVRMCFLFLGSLADQYCETMVGDEEEDLRSRKRFIQQNVVIQGELGQFFAPYHHLCPECDSCCYATQVPYSRLDMVLYGFPDRPEIKIASSFFLQQLGILQYHYLTILLRWTRIDSLDACKPELPEETRVSACLGANGCKIPLGQRPANCIFFACGPFLKNMDRGAFWQYLRLSLKYLRHLTLSLMAVESEWRQQARIAPLKGYNAHR